MVAGKRGAGYDFNLLQAVVSRPTPLNLVSLRLVPPEPRSVFVAEGSHVAVHRGVRLHGPDSHHLYGGSFSDRDLCWWADRIREWTAMGRDVFVYFNNDGEGNAVRNADQLRWLLG